MPWHRLPPSSLICFQTIKSQLSFYLLDNPKIPAPIIASFLTSCSTPDRGYTFALCFLTLLIQNRCAWEFRVLRKFEKTGYRCSPASTSSSHPLPSSQHTMILLFSTIECSSLSTLLNHHVNEKIENKVSHDENEDTDHQEGHWNRIGEHVLSMRRAYIVLPLVGTGRVSQGGEVTASGTMGDCESQAGAG